MRQHNLFRPQPHADLYFGFVLKPNSSVNSIAVFTGNYLASY